MGCLVELLGIERATETEGDTGAEENVVGNGSNTTVIDLNLDFHDSVFDPYSKGIAGLTLANETGSSLYLEATSRPTWLPLLESQVALAPASTCALTLW